MAKKKLTKKDLRAKAIFKRQNKQPISYEEKDPAQKRAKFNIPIAKKYYDLSYNLLCTQDTTTATRLIKQGADFIADDGTKVNNSEITSTPEMPRSYAYCSDTCYDESILQKIANVNLLYHEATFMNDKYARAVETYHSTTIQAGTIAKKANVKKLIIGHYSARYIDLEPMLAETKTVFENTVLAIEGEKYEVE